MKVEYKRDGKYIKRVVTTNIAMGSLKGKITRTKNELEHAKTQIGLWSKTTERKQKELDTLLAIERT